MGKELAGVNKAGIGDGISVELNGEVVGVKRPDPEIWHPEGGLNASSRDIEAANKAYAKAEAKLTDPTLVKNPEGVVNPEDFPVVDTNQLPGADYSYETNDEA